MFQWSYGYEDKILIGSDSIKGVRVLLSFLVLLLEALHSRGIFFLVQSINHWCDTYPIWKNAWDLGLIGVNELLW